MKRKFFPGLFIKISLSLAFISNLTCCKKNEIDIQFSQIATGTSDDLIKIKKLNAQTFYLCGGSDKSGFIMKSTDAGNSWILLQNNFLAKIYDLDFIKADAMIAVSAKIVFYRTTNDWKGWAYITPSNDEYPKTGYDSDLSSIDMVNDAFGYACGGKIYQQGVIYRTWDGGTTWHFTYKEHEMKSVVMLDERRGYASGYGVIYRTTDYGVNWIVTNAADDFFTCMSKVSPDHIFAAGYEGSILDAYGDGNWSKDRGGNKVFGKRVHFRCIDFFNANVGAAAGTNGVIYITHDGGNSWNAGSGFDQTQINSVLLTSENSGLAAGVKGKLFKFQF